MYLSDDLQKTLGDRFQSQEEYGVTGIGNTHNIEIKIEDEYGELFWIAHVNLKGSSIETVYSIKVGLNDGFSPEQIEFLNGILDSDEVYYSADIEPSEGFIKRYFDDKGYSGELFECIYIKEDICWYTYEELEVK